jgi:DNA-binding transcriptional LysR family regulator
MKNDFFTPARMRAFLAVARSLNFTVAAREVHLSQSAVSRQISALENALETRLFERVGSYVDLTAAGRALRPEASRILGDIERAQEVVRETAASGHERLRVGASSTPGLYLLPRVLCDYQRRFPNVDVRFVLSNTEKIEALLIENALDIGFVGSPVQGDVLAAEPLVDDEIVCVVHSRHRLARRRSVPVAELREETLVLREEGSSTRRLFVEWVRASGGSIGQTIDVACPEAVKSLAQAALGVGVLSAHALAGQAARSRLSVVRLAAPRMARTIWLVMHPQKHITRSLSAFRTAVLETVGRSARGATRVSR